MKTKIVKWGNSLGLRIPKRFAEEVRVREGSTVELSLDEDRLVIKLVDVPEYALEDLLGEITIENVHGEVDSGEPRGGEIW